MLLCHSLTFKLVFVFFGPSNQDKFIYTIDGSNIAKTWTVGATFDESQERLNFCHHVIIWHFGLIVSDMVNSHMVKPIT